MKKLLICVLVGCVLFDIFRNTSLVEYFSDGEGVTYYVNVISWAIAGILFALLPIVLRGIMGYQAALISAVFSTFAVLMGYFASDMSDIEHDKKYTYHTELARKLDAELLACDKMPARVCNSLDIREQIKANNAELASLQTVTLDIYDIAIMGKDINIIKIAKVSILILIGIFIPYSNRFIMAELRLVPDDGSTGSIAKNQHEKPRTSGGQRKKPNKDELDLLKDAYGKMKRNGESVSWAGLAKRAGVSKEKAGWYIKNGDLGNVTNIK